MFRRYSECARSLEVMLAALIPNRTLQCADVGLRSKRSNGLVGMTYRSAHKRSRLGPTAEPRPSISWTDLLSQQGGRELTSALARYRPAQPVGSPTVAGTSLVAIPAGLCRVRTTVAGCQCERASEALFSLRVRRHWKICQRFGIDGWCGGAGAR